MKIKQLQINSFRGFDNLNLEFNRNQPTVFIGINGAGKSTILDCLAILLSLLTVKIENSQNSPLSFNETDIKNGSLSTHNEIAISYENSQEFRWSLSKVMEGEEKGNSDDFSELEALVKQIRNNSLPVIVYYPTNRAVFEIPLRIKNKHSFEPKTALDEALTGGQINFRRFFEWFRHREDLENENFKYKPAEYPDRQLEAVRTAISQLLDGFTNLRIQRLPLRMTLEKQGKEIVIDRLSDGEKCLLAMVGDLARRLAIANPNLDNPLGGRGVVLIDEIELHLHPQWQREIVPKLTGTFPNCQFIITTHSPQVISHLKPESIYILESTSEGIIVKRPQSSFGRNSDRILEDLMATPARPQEIKENLLELFQLIEKGDLKKAKEMRQNIVDKIGADEPELVKAGVSIRRKEILNR
jgi:predicted ATP-binding protein involved in virulence